MELHIHMDSNYPPETYVDWVSTETAVRQRRAEVHTTQTHFCSWAYVRPEDDQLYVHYGDYTIQLVVGNNKSTDRWIKESCNLEKLLLGGEFDFEKGNIGG